METKKIIFNQHQPKEFEIDFSKIKTIEDVNGILKALDIKVYDNYTNFEKWKPFLKEVEAE